MFSKGDSVCRVRSLQKKTLELRGLDTLKKSTTQMFI